MPKKSFALEAGGPQRLEASWQGAFKDLALSFDGLPVAAFGDPKELKEPQAVVLPDGSRLEVQLAKVFVFPELRLLRDGEPIPGSTSDPVALHAAAWQMVLVIAGLNVAIGLVVELFDVTFLRAIGAGWGSVVSGLIYAVLAFFVRRQSIVALGLAVGLFALDGIFGMVAAMQSSGRPPVGGLVARVFFLIPMIRGFGAIRELGRPRRSRRPPSRVTSGSSHVASPAGTAAAAAPAAVRTLTGEAEKRRLHMSGQVAAAPRPTATAHRSISIKSTTSTDAAAGALRFLAHKCQIDEAGLHVTLPSGQTREVPWTDVGRIVVRQLPPDPPWDSGVILDLIALVGGRWEPVRVFGTTLVNYTVLAGGASTSRLDNLRRFARHVRERNPAVAIDEETQAFLDSEKAPARFANMTQLVEYDAVYGG